MACGLNHTLAVSADGSMVWAFGDGDYGKLGLGNSTAKSSPQVSIVFSVSDNSFHLCQYLFLVGDNLPLTFLVIHNGVQKLLLFILKCSAF